MFHEITRYEAAFQVCWLPASTVHHNVRLIRGRLGALAGRIGVGEPLGGANAASRRRCSIGGLGAVVSMAIFATN